MDRTIDERNNDPTSDKWLVGQFDSGFLVSLPSSQSYGEGCSRVAVCRIHVGCFYLYE